MNHTVLIADESIELCESVTKLLAQTGEIGAVYRAESAADILDTVVDNGVDIVVLDLMLTEMDGVEIISRLRKLNRTVKVIALTYFKSETILSQLMSLGVDYILLKPVQGEVVARRIQDLLRHTQEPEVQKTAYYARSTQEYSPKNSRKLDEKISNIFISVGIPAHIKGYQFLREAIKLTISQPDLINSITKRLYPAVADVYATSPSKVERAIRHAIEVAWNRGRIENINSLFGIKVYCAADKPTNGEFIALVADKMLIEGT